MKKHVALIFALLFTSTASFAAGHILQIKTDGPATKSLYLVGRDQLGAIANGKCIENLKLKPGWFSTAYKLNDGSNYSVLAFSSPNCTSGLRKSKKGVVPSDNLTYFWLPLF